jgi:NAD(P)-dependent dehydrogenase (short-subunit alcohol dehydrogenase family)
VSIVTGAGRGIGKAISLGLARGGADLVLVSRTKTELEVVADELRSFGSSVMVHECDVSVAGDVQGLMQETADEYGKVDVLINNAGVLGPVGPLDENDIDEWMNTLRINLYGVFLCCKYVLPYMKRQRRGKIINISGAGAPAPYPRFSAYSSSKTGVLGLTQTLAEEVKEFGIQVNAIAPGIINTKMQDQILAAGGLAGASYDRAKELKEKGGVDPVKVANLAAFLSSDASDGITGRFFSARWDDWQSLNDESKLKEFIQSEMYTVRRIDGVFFSQVKGAQKT